MSWRTDDWEPLTTRQAFENLNVETLKPLVKLCTREVPTRKAELVSFLVDYLSRSKQVRELYQGLEPLAQKAVQEATHDPEGRLHQDRFKAKYGQMPAYSQPDPKARSAYYSYYDRRSRPTALRLFFPHSDSLPTNLRKLLLSFVPAPPEFTLETRAELPATVTLKWHTWKAHDRVEESEDVPLRVRQTARAASHDVKAMLRLIELGRVRVTDKKRQPTRASVKAVSEILQGGDFYTAEDEDEDKSDPSGDLAIKAFAWPMLVQAAGLADRRGDHLELTEAGRKALTRPPEEVIRTAWKKWRTSTLLDEFSRVDAVKGQNKGGLSALAVRRQAVADGLAAGPVGSWFAIKDYFRFLRATGRDFVLSRTRGRLYIGDYSYGELGGGSSSWETLEGRYLLAVLFEYMATLGLIDVAYLVPQWGWDDSAGGSDTVDLSCLSRYDGLRYVRISSLGAWCLGLADRYEPPAPATVDLLQVLPNRDVVVKHPPLPASERLLLERFAEPQSEAVWRLTANRILAVLESGGTLDELVEFLSTHSANPIPPNVRVFLDDLGQQAGKLRDLGLARMIECADAMLAKMLASDPQLRGKCHPAGERWLVFRAEDEAAVRKALRRLGHILPPPREG